MEPHEPAASFRGTCLFLHPGFASSCSVNFKTRRWDRLCPLGSVPSSGTVPCDPRSRCPEVLHLPQVGTPTSGGRSQLPTSRAPTAGRGVGWSGGGSSCFYNLVLRCHFCVFAFAPVHHLKDILQQTGPGVSRAKKDKEEVNWVFRVRHSQGPTVTV